MTTTTSSDNNSSASSSSHKEPSLGPACLVVAILCLAGGSAICAFASFFLFGNQPPIAIKAIEKQLIPWIENSHLAPADKESIIEQLDGLIVQIDSGSVDAKQLTRLHNCLQDNPVILWGEIQSIENQASGTGMTETELEGLKRTNQRLLRMAAERKLGRSDLEYAIQLISSVRKEGDTLEVNKNLTAEQIQGYVKRVEPLLNRSEVPNEPFEKTPAEAFAILLEAALKVPKQN